MVGKIKKFSAGYLEPHRKLATKILKYFKGLAKGKSFFKRKKYAEPEILRFHRMILSIEPVWMDLDIEFMSHIFQ